MDTDKVTATLLVLTIILSVATVGLSLSLINGGPIVVGNSEGSDNAAIGFYVEGAENASPAQIERSSAGLYVESGK